MFKSLSLENFKCFEVKKDFKLKKINVFSNICKKSPICTKNDIKS